MYSNGSSSNLKEYYRTQAKKKGYVKTSQNWLVIMLYIIVPILIIFPLYRFIRKQLAKNNEQISTLEKDKSFKENLNPLVQQTKANQITSRIDVQEAARQLAHHLGTKYSDKNSIFSVFDPRGWFENDTKVADILIFQRNNYKLLERLYYQCYTNSRSLSDDILALLDDDQLKRVQKYLKI